MFFPGQLIMSVHRRSPLCKEYLDYYKFGANKFKKDVDNNMSKIGDPNETVFTALLAGLNKGTEQSPMLKKKQLELQGDDSDFGAGNAIQEVNEEKKQESIGSTERQKRKAAAEKRLEEIKIELDETSSNSTDYGINHAKQVLKYGPGQYQCDNSDAESVSSFE